MILKLVYNRIIIIYIIIIYTNIYNNPIIINV